MWYKNKADETNKFLVRYLYFLYKCMSVFYTSFYFYFYPMVVTIVPVVIISNHAQATWGDILKFDNNF